MLLLTALALAAECWPDVDGDGFGDANADPEVHDTCPQGYETSGTDCDDTDDEVHPAQIEVCNGRDDNCNGLVDDDVDDTVSGCLDFYRDADGDLFGDADEVECVCPVEPAPEPYASAGLDAVLLDGVPYISRQFDCDDTNPAIFPDSRVTRDGDGVVTHRIERLNGHDDDCDGVLALIELECDSDGVFAALPTSPPPDIRHADDVGLVACSDAADPPSSVFCWDGAKLNLQCDPITQLWVTEYQTDDGHGGRFDGGRRVGAEAFTLDDCDDTCSARFPGHEEVCDGRDNDCSDVVLPADLDGVPDPLVTPLPGTVDAGEVDQDSDGVLACTDRDERVFVDGCDALPGFDTDEDPAPADTAGPVVRPEPRCGCGTSPLGTTGLALLALVAVLRRGCR